MGGRIRLRVALHAGEIHSDPYGFTGRAINDTFRLVDAEELRRGLESSSGQLAIITSDWFYHEVVWHYPAARPASYRNVQVVVKEADTSAWVRLPT
jgi:hypothetical protein